MSERKNLIEKPKKTITDALHAVKGENTAKLIEEFTAEMTLVAEGLCEDQQKLRHVMDSNETQTDKRFQSQESHIELLEKMIDEEHQNHDRTITELRNRLTSLEKQHSTPVKKEKKGNRNIIRDLTLLISIAAAAWVAVTLINKLL